MGIQLFNLLLGRCSLQTTRRTLNDKIAQLNTAIDEVSAQLEDSDSALRADHLTARLLTKLSFV